MESMRREKEVEEEAKRKAQLERFKKDAEERALKEQAEKERREKEREAKKERERLEREEFEKREREREEKKRRELDEKKLKEEKDRKEREERDKKLREEREQREKEEREKRQREKEELEERMKKDREEKDRLKKQREQEEKELREKLAKEKEEKEKADREKREKEKQEREERERLDKEKREKELRERREREEKEKREREEKEKREREEREKKEKEDREKKLEEDRLRREREQQERELKAQRDKEERDRIELQRKEDEDRRKREKEEEDRQKREAAEAQRKQREKEEEDRRLREKQEADKKEKERLDREEKDRLEKQRRDEEEKQQKLENEIKERQAREKREKEEADRKEKERLADLDKKKAEEQLRQKQEQEQAAKNAAAAADDGFDDFEDDFGDMDDILESIEAKKPAAKTPEPIKAPETKPPVTVAPASKPDPKKKPPADEEFEFDDLDDDGFEDLIEESMDPKKKQPATKPDPVKPATKAEPDKPSVNKQPPTSQLPTKPGAVAPVDNILKHKKVFTSEHAPLEDQYINSVMPMSEEEVQHTLGALDVSGQLLNMLFNEFISSKLMFMLDLEETDIFLQICLAWVQTGKLEQKNIDTTAAAIADNLTQMFDGDYKDIKYIFAPFDVIEEFQEESICLAILDVKNLQVLLVSLNPSITEADVRKNPFAQKLCSILARVTGAVLESGPDRDVHPDSISLIELKPELREFFIDSCEDPSLRFAIITYLILFENATDSHDFDGFKQSLALDTYTAEHALRFVSTIRNLGESLKIRTELSQQPELLEGLMAVVQMNMRKFNLQVIVNTAEEVTPASELQEKIGKDFEEVLELKSSATKVFAVLEYCPTESKKLLYFILLQNEEPSIVLYLDTNCEPENFKCLSVLESSLKESSLPYNVYFEHARHQFIQNNVDVFVYTWLIQVCENGLSGIDALRLLVYNEVPFVSEIMQADMDGEEEGGIGLEDGQEEMMVGDDEFDEDFDDILGEPKGAAGKASKPDPKASKPALKPAPGGFEDGDEFDDIDSGELGFAPKAKKSEPKKSNNNLKPGTQKKDNNFDYGDEFDDDFDNEVAKDDGFDEDFDF